MITVLIDAFNKNQGIPSVVRWLLESHQRGVAYETRSIFSHVEC